MNTLFKKCWMALLSGCLAIFAAASNAVIIEGNFKARISDVYIDGGNLLGDMAVGQQVLGSFWYDTSLMGGGPSVSDPNVAWYGGHDNWLNVSYQINGKAFQVTQGPEKFPDIQSIEHINIQKYDPDLWWDILDMYWIYQEFKYSDQSTSIFDYLLQDASIILWYGLDDLNYVDLIQEFSLHGQNEWDTWGYAYINLLQVEGSQVIATSITADIYDFTIGPRQEATVPEPPPISLFGLVLLLLGWGVRRQSKVTYFKAN